jgi:hypothetical protein
MKAERVVRWCLAGAIVALLLVGLVSGTPIRHVIQALPAAIALALLAKRSSAAS